MSDSLLTHMIDETHSLKDMALLIRRAGLEHLVSDVSADEVRALADAGDVLAMERTAYLVLALNKPGHALKSFDGGASLKAEVKALAYAIAGRS